MISRILCVDDDVNVLAAYQRSLRKRFSIEVAASGEEGLARIQAEGPFAVIVADMQMPVMNGIQFLSRVQETAPDSVRIMLTGNADQTTAIAAVNQGHVFQFLTKPCVPEVLARTLELGIRQYQLVTSERELLEKTLNGSVQILIDVLSTADPEAFGTGQTLRRYIRTFAESLRVEQTWEMELAAMLSRIGYVTIPPVVQQKQRLGLLASSESEMLQRVPEIGAGLLAQIPRLETVSQIIRYQEKRFDGSGFPADAVAGEDIPIGARILKVMRDLVELEGKGQTQALALKQMKKRTGWYDPKVLDSACACFDIYLPEGETNQKAALLVRVGELRVGHVLISAVQATDGSLLVPAGTPVTPMVMERIRNFARLVPIVEPLRVDDAELRAAA
jgi:response regulator RpfG family c-di-GMP phosphodiesterase